MAKVKFFYVNGCPYCAQARKAREELISENPAYGKVEFEEIYTLKLQNTMITGQLPLCLWQRRRFMSPILERSLKKPRKM